MLSRALEHARAWDGAADWGGSLPSRAGSPSGVGRVEHLPARTNLTRLHGRPVALLFFEDSTRTRVSFEIAAMRLGVPTVSLGSSSSVNKGESIADTARTIEAMGVGAIVVRARASGSAHLVSRVVRVPVVNAGDGRHEHPTQGLLDCLTLCEALGREDFDLSGVRVAIVGDVVSSRVARSGIAGIRALGGSVVCVGPPHLVPAAMSALGCEVSRDLDRVLGGVDGVMMLRVQKERHEGTPIQGGERSPGQGDRWGDAGSILAYRSAYALTRERAATMRPGAVVMHPGPMNRGVEIDGDVADGPRSVILEQVANGLPVRMAAIDLLLGATAPL